MRGASEPAGDEAQALRSPPSLRRRSASRACRRRTGCSSATSGARCRTSAAAIDQESLKVPQALYRCARPRRRRRRRMRPARATGSPRARGSRRRARRALPPPRRARRGAMAPSRMQAAEERVVGPARERRLQAREKACAAAPVASADDPFTAATRRRRTRAPRRPRRRSRRSPRPTARRLQGGRAVAAAARSGRDTPSPPPPPLPPRPFRWTSSCGTSCKKLRVAKMQKEIEIERASAEASDLKAQLAELGAAGRAGARIAASEQAAGALSAGRSSPSATSRRS